jgi:hypothetical protein
MVLLSKRALLLAAALRTGDYPTGPAGVLPFMSAVQLDRDRGRTDTEAGAAAADFPPAFFKFPTVHFFHNTSSYH